MTWQRETSLPVGWEGKTQLQSIASWRVLGQEAFIPCRSANWQRDYQSSLSTDRCLTRTYVFYPKLGVQVYLNIFYISLDHPQSTGFIIWSFFVSPLKATILRGIPFSDPQKPRRSPCKAVALGTFLIQPSACEQKLTGNLGFAPGKGVRCWENHNKEKPSPTPEVGGETWRSKTFRKYLPLQPWFVVNAANPSDSWLSLARSCCSCISRSCAKPSAVVDARFGGFNGQLCGNVAAGSPDPRMKQIWNNAWNKTKDIQIDVFYTFKQLPDNFWSPATAPKSHLVLDQWLGQKHISVQTKQSWKPRSAVEVRLSLPFASLCAPGSGQNMRCHGCRMTFGANPIIGLYTKQVIHLSVYQILF